MAGSRITTTKIGDDWCVTLPGDDQPYALIGLFSYTPPELNDSAFDERGMLKSEHKNLVLRTYDKCGGLLSKTKYPHDAMLSAMADAIAYIEAAAKEQQDAEQT